MDAKELWEQLQTICQLDSGEDSPFSFQEVVAVSFSEKTNLLTLQAKDAAQALYMNAVFADKLITALEGMVGVPAFIECTYNPHLPKDNPRFSVRRTNADYSLHTPDKSNQKSALETVLEDIADLKRRVSDLEKI